MKTMWRGALLAALGVLTVHSAPRAEEVELKPSDVPAAVMDTLKAH